MNREIEYKFSIFSLKKYMYIITVLSNENVQTHGLWKGNFLIDNENLHCFNI